jgi:hypothetical protein
MHQATLYNIVGFASTKMYGNDALLENHKGNFSRTVREHFNNKNQSDINSILATLYLLRVHAKRSTHMY